MPQNVQEYSENDVIKFLKEEFERIIANYPLRREGSALVKIK